MAVVTKTVKDAAYVTVGLGVLAVQRAQVARRDLTKQVEAQLTTTAEQVKGLSKQTGDRVQELSKQTGDRVQELSKKVDDRVQGLSKKVEGRLGQFELTVPAQAKDLMKQARSAAETLQGQVLNRTPARSTGAKKKTAASANKQTAA